MIQREFVLFSEHGQRPEGRERRAAIATGDNAASRVELDVVMRAFTGAVGAIVGGDAQGANGITLLMACRSTRGVVYGVRQPECNANGASAGKRAREIASSRR